MTPPEDTQLQVGAKLLQHHQKWKGTGRWVEKVVKEGLRLPFTGKAPGLRGTTIQSGESPAVKMALQEFIEKGALEPATEKGFTARLFVD